MSLHIEASPGEIASTVLITGDPLRAKFFAENILQNPQCYNRVRGMFGYTGTYQDKSVSIQGTGIGIPSTALYIHELIHSYHVKKIIRVGTCGALQADIGLGEIIVASKATSDSAAVKKFSQREIQLATEELLAKSELVANKLNIAVHKGLVFSTDLFYDDNPNRYNPIQKQGALCADMETSILYAMGAYYWFQCLSLLTVSDHIITGLNASPKYRESQTQKMLQIALEL